MTQNRLLVLTLSLVLVTGLGTPAFAQSDPDAGFSDVAQAGDVKAAGAVATDGTWFEFGILSEFDVKGCFPADPAGPLCIPSTGTPTTFVDAPPWTFSCLSGGCWLTVTDAFDQNDQFEVFDNNVQIGTTSLPDMVGQCAPNNTDPEDCLADPGSSSGMFLLGSGAHSITFTGVPQGSNSGAAYFKVIQHAAVGGEFSLMSTSALLLAGTQNMMAWMIPLVVAVAGFGLVIARKL